MNDLFHAAADLPAPARPAWLDAQCGEDADLRREVESLLAEDALPDGAGAFGPVVDAAIAEVGDAASAIHTLTRVGPYRILREIGAGGMGTVFLAERDDEFHQRVAVKVVRGVLSREVLTRFRAERQILASLEHPAIARLLDGGTTPSGLPYLVMEYVEGVPIDEYCRERGLSIRDRLALFARVCDGVSYAHRSLVVHRDLKPSNILVTADGAPKLLDFGIAKLLDSDAGAAPAMTVTGLRALTPEYASPEQIRGQPITTATDVYSLGVLLYELLTGERPLAFATHQPIEIERVVCTVEPRRPSTVTADARQARQLAGDLDTIVLTALAKEPARRYQSAAHLAEDIGRFANGLPIVARPATWRYRASRFVTRHRIAVAAGAVVAMLVVGFGVALAVQDRRVRRERDTANQVSDLLIGVYRSLDPARSGGSLVTSREILDRSADRIRTEWKDQPELQARMLESIGSVYSSVGLPERALAALRDSLALHRSTGAHTLATAQTLDRLATALWAPQRFEEAEGLAREALEIRQRLAGPRAPETAESLNTLGLILYVRGHGIDGARLIGEALDIWRVTSGPGSPEFANAFRNLALTWRERADYLKAERFSSADLLKVEQFERNLLDSRRKTLGNAHALTADSVSALGQLLHFSGRDGEAEPVLREALAIRQRVAGLVEAPAFAMRDNLGIVESRHNLAAALHDEGKLDEAEQLYRDAVEGLRARLGEHPQLAINLTNYATVLEDQGRVVDAEAAYRQALAVRRRRLGADDPAVARTLDHLARLLDRQQRHADALPLATEALAIRRAKLGEHDYETAASMITQARTLAALGRASDALPLLRAGHAIRVAALPPGDPRLRDEAQLLSTLR